MCGIIVSTKDIKDISKVIKYSRFRGPDSVNTLKKNGFTFVHQLLQITGNSKTQPFVKEDILCIFNGEIYNYNEFGDYDSDGECLIDAYIKYGNNFVKELDGEFALVLIDFSKDTLIFSTDVFSTKPLFYSIKEKNIGLASYESNLKFIGFNNIKKLEANTTVIYDLKSFTIKKSEVFSFNLEQKNENLDKIFQVFESAVLKRTTNLKYPFYLGLSSGYDSGSIAACLNKYGIDYTIYTMECREHVPTLMARHKLHTGNKFYLKNNIEKFEKMKKYFANTCEKYNYKNRKLDVSGDKGTIGVGIIAKHAKSIGIKICISGQGPDEIMSDYSINNKPAFKGSDNTHTCFNGKFPEDLKEIFPWKNFFGNCQEDYLMKEELANGLFSIEGRYPFLDKFFVQEFLNLTCQQKNKGYKNILKEYMEQEQYPYAENYKVGFSASSNLEKNNTDWINS